MTNESTEAEQEARSVAYCPRLPGQHWHSCKAGLVTQDGRAVCVDCRLPSPIKPDYEITACFFSDAALGEIEPPALLHLVSGGRFFGLDYDDYHVRRALRDIKDDVLWEAADADG